MNRILIKVFWGDNSPIVSGSETDSALVQSAFYAHDRIKQEYSDFFLFLFCGVESESEAYKVIARYGFPNQTIICIPADYEGEVEDFNDYNWFDEFIEYEIESWLRKNHPGALPCLMTDNYESMDAWWSGIEAGKNWSWDKSFARSLPETHYHRADTWMEILCETAKCDWESWKEEQEFRLQMASLCEWLHGFEQVSENCYNTFEAIPENFGLDNEYLLYAAMKIKGECDTLSIDEAEDGKDLFSQALQLIVCDKRGDIANDLIEYFGGETGLYYTLWFCIRPDYKRSMMELLINDSLRFDDLPNMLNTWEFVTDGWSDRAEPQ
jgi:hypothetical protein